MSMRYFTLSAVCMLIFCMLLALSGTTDFPGGHPGMASQSGLVPSPPISNHPGKGAVMASLYPLAGGEDPSVGGKRDEAAAAGVARHYLLLLLGAAFIAGWILLSFRLLSRSRR
jgi:hypothetical protein